MRTASHYFPKVSMVFQMTVSLTGDINYLITI